MIDTTVSLAVDDREGTSDQALLYPLRFEPIYQYRLWGGRHLAACSPRPCPVVLSEKRGYSVIATTIRAASLMDL